MTNEQLRLTRPIWQDSIDTGEMFNAKLSIYQDTDDVKLSFLAVVSGWSGGQQRRVATLEDAIVATRDLMESFYGIEL
jgi:hypothetical protein